MPDSLNATNNPIVIESREQLLGWLAEAAEIEHNLMCCYLYAMFSLKHERNGMSDDEWAAVERWRNVLRGVALEEMTHLALVSNLTSAVGGTPHFNRPNFPVSPGAYPAHIVIELAPFSLDTIRHFCFLERPEHTDIADGAAFTPQHRYARRAPRGRLMPYAADYASVGFLYQAIGDALCTLAEQLGEAQLFSGHGDHQVGPTDSHLPGLMKITDLESAEKALETIVAQGEGSWGGVDSHFERFSRVEREYVALLERNPAFEPAYAIPRNPVMRIPPTPEGRVWMNHPDSCHHVDLANALYVYMLRLLMQAYATPDRHASLRRLYVRASHAAMSAVTPLAARMALLPGNEPDTRHRAGMSFAMVRGVAAITNAVAAASLLHERLGEITRHAERLCGQDQALIGWLPTLDNLHKALDRIAAAAIEVSPSPSTGETSGAAGEKGTNMSNTMAPNAASTLVAGDGVDVAKGKAITVSFNSKKCIHARFCVTGLPGVFKANTPGEWIFPDATSPERLAAVAEACPSGAIQYQRDDGRHEPPPPVNLIHIRENGPLAFRGDLHLNGEAIGYRATLCRCGQSKNKPYCDGSHTEAKFTASGEPASGETAMLSVRDGAVTIAPQKNGPLAVEGNIELCAGTGRVVMRGTEAYLCRCGQSRNKPFCDGSHVAAGFQAD